MKPRARWSPYGVGYWVVWDVFDGTCYLGSGPTVEEAYADWCESILRSLQHAANN